MDDWQQSYFNPIPPGRGHPIRRIENMIKRSDVQRAPESPAKWSKSQSRPEPLKQCANGACHVMHLKKGPYCSDDCSKLTYFIRQCRAWLRSPEKQADPGWNEVFAVYIGKFNSTAVFGSTTYNPHVPPELRRQVI